MLIGLAYFSIPMALGVFLYHRRDVRFGWAIWMFVLFIMLCGVTHFMMVWTLWNPDYGVEALIKAATATASLVTAAALWPLLPRAIAIPSAATLQARIEERDGALAELQAVMATMVRLEEHQRQQASLLDQVHRSEARLRSVFENAAVGIARVAPDGRFLEVNDRFMEIVGWSRQHLLAGDFQHITHPDDLDADISFRDRLLRGEADRVVFDKRYIREDGETVWVRLTVSLARDAEAKPDHFVTIAEDVTQELYTEQTRDLLMREVDHRARNALTVVQSVVRLTDASDCDRYKEVVTGRIDALARAQASLARTNWQGADLGEVVEDELAALGAAYRYSAEGPRVALPPPKVQPLSMMLHELATNAIKHGALSTDGGRVDVRWFRQGDDGWRLTWVEAGGPQVRKPERMGFGSRLIRRLSVELEARIEMNWKSGGLRVEIVAPDHDRASRANQPRQAIAGGGSGA